MSDPATRSAARRSCCSPTAVDPVPDELSATAGVTACHAAGITYRQLDYWARTGLVVPSVRDASGSGTQRLYSFRDLVVLKVVKRLLDAGVSLQNIRGAIEHAARARRRRPGRHHADLRRHDGVRVPLAGGGRRPAQGGQGVFGIAIGGAFKEIQGRCRTCRPSGPSPGRTPPRRRRGSPTSWGSGAAPDCVRLAPSRLGAKAPKRRVARSVQRSAYEPGRDPVGAARVPEAGRW